MKKPSKKQSRIDAMEQVKELFAAASANCSSAAAARFVRQARRLAMRHRFRLPSSLKRHFCKHCHAFLRPGVNCRVRLAKQRVIYRCDACKHFMRFPYCRTS